LPVAVFRIASLIRKLSLLAIQSWLYYGDLIATAALYLSGRRHQTRLYWGGRCSDISQRYSIQSRLAVAACVKVSRFPDAVVANSYSGRRTGRPMRRQQRTLCGPLTAYRFAKKNAGETIAGVFAMRGRRR
jgi:hypothetical protein